MGTDLVLEFGVSARLKSRVTAWGVRRAMKETAVTCNIDSRGKAARLIYGIVVLAIGVVLVFLWALRGGGILGWVISAVCVVMGVFSIFEARAGWCVVRAMGFRTPM